MESITFPLKRGMAGPAVANLQDGLKLLVDNRLLLSQDEDASRDLSAGLAREREEQSFAGATRKLVGKFQEEHGREVSGEVDRATAEALNRLLEQIGAFRPATLYRITGTVAARGRPSAAGLQVVIVDKSVGGDTRLTDAATDRSGRYEATFPESAFRPSGKEKPDLQARVLAGELLIGASETRFDSSPVEILDIVLDDKAAAHLESEYESLTGDLAIYFRGALKDLEENDERQDVTYLANKAGWDARAVALASLADQFSARTARGQGDARIEPAFFYALFRSGVPANQESLYRLDPAAAGRVWRQALKQGVIPAALEEGLDRTVRTFRQLSSEKLLDDTALAGHSSFDKLLSLSLPEAAKRKKFAALYTEHGARPALWDSVASEFGEATARRIRIDGQLAYLTLNNAPLIERLNRDAGDEGVQDPGQLAERGFHRAAKWNELIDSSTIPPEIAGRNEEEKRAAYSDLLAAQIRLSYPTAVVASMVKERQTPIGPASLRNRVHSFLQSHQREFEIGVQPVAQFVARRGLQVEEEVVREVTKIQRVYQITPDHDSMNGLLGKGFDSSQAVIRLEKDEFVRAMRDEVGGPENAALIHDKATQVHMAVLNIALTFLAARGAPAIGVHSPPSIIDPSPTAPTNAADVLAYPTLEGLFGEMDYCACEHCRSILSPAAYLVDLLMFLDRPASEIPTGFTNPVDVLLERRPDIQHLPLTCENTNTPLPYIDLVNETLEAFIANGLTLAGFEGHSTGPQVAPEALLANPQFVQEAAYNVLAGENFPPPLPFHHPLERVRRHFGQFDAPLARVMESIRKGDDLERPSAADYGWRDIWMETLGLSRPEHRLLIERWSSAGATDVMLTVKELYGFASATSDSDVRTLLDNAKSFCRRLGISYHELADLLRTRFVNPNANLIPRLERLGITFVTMKALKDGTISDSDFDDLIASGVDPEPYGGDIKAWIRTQPIFDRIMSLITLTNPADPDDVCDFEAVELRYSNADMTSNKLRAFEFVKLIRFYRLWKKLGWTIEETDKAITALMPSAPGFDDPSDAVNLERLDEAFLILLPRLGIVQRLIEILALKPGRDLLPLLACFAPIDWCGPSSLYRKMFLSPRNPDTAFAEQPGGEILTDSSAKLVKHSATLRAAFSLTASEFDLIVADLGFDSNSALSLDNISAVHRRGWLARRLKLSVREFLLLTGLTGLDPFDLSDPTDPPILRLLKFLGDIRAVGLKPEQLLYLLWNQDLSGRSSPPLSTVTDLVRSIRSAIVGTEAEFAIADDPEGSLAREKMALVLGNEAADLFFGLLDNRVETSTLYGHGSPELEPVILAAAPGRIAYDDLRKRLSFTGLLQPADRDALKSVSGVSQDFKDAVDRIFADNEARLRPLFGRYPKLLALHDAYLASNDPVEMKRGALLLSILPDLLERRKRQQTLQLVSAAAGADPGLSGAILEDPFVLHAAGDPPRPALDDLTALEAPGLSASYYFAAAPTANADVKRAADGAIDFASGGTRQLPGDPSAPASPISATWDGFLEVTENGFINLRVDTDSAAIVSVSINGSTVAMAQNGGAWSNVSPIELKAGALNPLTLQVNKVRDRLVLSWQTEATGWEVVPAPHLYSSSLVERVHQAYLRLLKASALGAALKLSHGEFVHFAADGDLAVGGKGWLNALPALEKADDATAVALYSTLEKLAGFARMKSQIAPDDERWLEVIRNPFKSAEKPDSLLFALTRWEKGSLDEILTHWGKTSVDLAHLDTFLRTNEGYQWISSLGITARALVESTTNDPTAAIASELEAAQRARYENSVWLDVLKPINDEMRSIRRDALVGRILHHMRSDSAFAHVDTPEKLFEHFLMDVQMQPCMLTSRIRHALSSVQLFIERCLMNLEKRVSPASLKSKQWHWMKRYRIWEANRKVFIYPENWLEPELRDDQSPFFKETMSELLQGEINEEKAAEALLNYLLKLEEVAKLEICGIHYEEASAGVADDILHVIGRTAGAKRKYFYRRREYGYWTPWEKINLDIEDNPVLPVIWKDRLFLFWLKLLKEAQPNPPAKPSGGTLAGIDPGAMFPQAPKILVRAILNWSEFIGGTWQPTRTSDPGSPLLLAEDLSLADVEAFRSNLRLSALFWAGGGLRVIASYKGWKGSSFFLHNPFSKPEQRNSKKDQHFSPRRTLDTSSGTFTAIYSGANSPHGIVSSALEDRTTEPHHPVGGDAWDAPFFYEDARHAFLVSTEDKMVMVPHWNDFGVVTKTLAAPGLIAPLVVPHTEALKTAGIATVKQPGFGLVDPVPIEHFVSEDAYLRNGIGTLGTVRFGDREIGLMGSDARVAINR